MNQPPDLAPLLNAIDGHIQATVYLRSFLVQYNGDGEGLIEAGDDFKKTAANVLVLLAPMGFWAALSLDMEAQIAAGTLAADGVTALNMPYGAKDGPFYAADELLEPEQWPYGLWNVDKWRPSIHMPRWASRLTLEVTAVRVERLQDITVIGAIDEGIKIDDTSASYVGHFQTLWDKINGRKHPWSSNPFVWVVEFRRVDTRPAGEEQAQ